MARQSVFDMKVSQIYPLLIQKAERKGRTKQEVGEIQDPLMQKIRWIDKLIDELAKGKPMDTIKR